MSDPKHSAPPQESKKPIVPIVIGLIAVVAVGLGVFFAMGGFKKKVEIPDVVYLESADAKDELSKAGLKPGNVIEEQTSDFNIGDLVIRTNPAAGTTVDEGTAVDIVVSVGQKLKDPVTVPDLTGMTPEEAESKLYGMLLIPQPGEQKYSDDVEAGKICAQSVAPGTQAMPIETVVTYSISLGRDEVEVPDVAGKSADEARKALSDAGLSCDTTHSYSDSVKKDVVISQSIESGKKVDKGTTVSIEISLGTKPPAKVVVPNIYSYNRDEAIRALESAGLKYSYSGDEDGTVVSVRPAVNAQVDQGSTVEFELKRPAATVQPQQSSNNNNNNNYNNNNNGNNTSDSANNDNDDGMNVSYDSNEATNIALEFFGAGGAAKGPANNVSVRGPIEGGGTIYYAIAFDLGDARCECNVDATDGHIYAASETVNGIETNLDENGNPIGSYDHNEGEVVE